MKSITFGDYLNIILERRNQLDQNMITFKLAADKSNQQNPDKFVTPEDDIYAKAQAQLWFYDEFLSYQPDEWTLALQKLTIVAVGNETRFILGMTSMPFSDPRVKLTNHNVRIYKYAQDVINKIDAEMKSFDFVATDEEVHKIQNGWSQQVEGYEEILRDYTDQVAERQNPEDVERHDWFAAKLGEDGEISND